VRQTYVPDDERQTMTEWQTPEHALGYLERADRIPYRAAGEAILLEELPGTLRRVLDLGAGDGRLLDLVLQCRPSAAGLAIDFSPPMLERMRQRFADTSRVQILAHNLEDPLPSLGLFDAVVSSFAIHHVDHQRKRHLYEEIWDALKVGGVFCNLEHVASASAYAHERFLEAMGARPEDEDPSNKLLDFQTQLMWLRDIGFADVDCYWKWRELALLVGRKPDRSEQLT
jgi:tRNA (cmo5U34)-methyltransferase